MRILGEEWEADDVAQNVFYKIWCLRDMLVPPAGASDTRFNAFVFMIARNEAIDLLRSLKQIRAFQDKFVQEISCPAAAASEDDRLDSKRCLYLINKIVASMPRVRREVFVLSRFKNKSNQAIAEFLGISKRTVERHINLSLKQIRLEIANRLQ